MDPLQHAEQWLASTTGAHTAVVEDLSQTAAVLTAMKDRIGQLEGTLQELHARHASDVKEVKLVAAKMIKEREDALIRLKKEVHQLEAAASRAAAATAAVNAAADAAAPAVLPMPVAIMPPLPAAVSTGVSGVATGRSRSGSRGRSRSRSGSHSSSGGGGGGGGAS